MAWGRWIFAALVLLAAAALTTPPFQMIPMVNARVVARLNVWTGRVDMCVPEGKQFICTPGADDLPPGFEVIN